jgi:hypothetical protein
MMSELDDYVILSEVHIYIEQPLKTLGGGLRTEADGQV